MSTLTRFDYNVRQAITVTENNVVGPTSNTAYRNNANLPWPASRSNGVPNNNTINVLNDANTIYIDPVNGNDANNGTTLNTQAVLTIGRAWALATAIRHTIHIEVLGAAVGTAWSLSQDWTAIASNSNVLRIQCAAGQTGTITSTNYLLSPGPFPPFTTGNIRATNGIEFNLLNTGVGLGSSFNLRASAQAISCLWCRFRSGLDNSLMAILGSPTTITITDNDFVSTAEGGIIINTSTNGAFTITRNIFDASASTGLINNPVIAMESLTLAVTMAFNHNTVIKYQNLITQTALVPITWSTLHSNIIHKVSRILNPDGEVNASITLENSLINVTNLSNVTSSSATNVFNQDPLFINEAGRDYRLRHVGRISSGSSYYLFNSPAVGIGLSDAGAFSVTYAFGAETADEWELLDGDGWENQAPLERVNYQGFDNIRGRFFNTWDSERWKVIFRFTGDYFQGFDQTAKFLDMYRSKTLLRWYPTGDDGLWGAAGISITVNSATEIDTGTNIPVRTLPDATTLAGSDVAIPNWYNGFVMKINWTDGGPMEGYFEIVSHTADTWTLEYIRGDEDITSGTGFTANIMYLPCLLDMPEAPIIAPYVSTCDGKQETWLAPQGNVTSAGYQTEEPHILEFTIKQSREKAIDI